MDLATLRYSPLTLADLAAAVQRYTAGLRATVLDERVSAAPDERTLRYYQSLGVMDRPIRHEGRQAIYGYRHLLQALAVKALQAEGLSLAQVQRALAGADDATLERAVLEAMGASTTTPPGPSLPAPPPPPPQAPTRPGPRWVSVELAPGLLVSIDPSRWPDPEALLAAVVDALPSNPSPRRGASS